MDNAEKRRKEVLEQMEIQKTILEKLEGVCSVLMERLAPISHQEPPSTKGEGEDVVALVPIAEELKAYNECICRVNDRLGGIIDRLEL